MSHVLIVDDDPKFLTAFSEFLSGGGHRVSAASCAEDALDSLPRLQPAVVVMDVFLPGLNGLEAFRRIKRKNPRLPVIIMSGHDISFSSRQAQELGAFEFYHKPFDPEAMLASIRRAAEQQENRSQANSEHILDGRQPCSAQIDAYQVAALNVQKLEHELPGRLAAAMDEFENALQYDEQLAEGYDRLSRLHLAHAETQLCDPKAAIRHAKTACELTGYQRWDYLQTLAAAHAAGGHYEKAMRWIQKSIQLAPEGQESVCQQLFDAWADAANAERRPGSRGGFRQYTSETAPLRNHRAP